MRTNPPLRIAILAAALVVFFALPSLASAGQVVPPGNSAATQYTQVFPTSGGNVAVGTSIGETGSGGGKKPPSKVIGKQTTEELESQGPEGKAVAQLAAESAPETTSRPETGQSSSGAGNSGNSGDEQDGAKQGGGGNGNGAKAGGGAQPGGAGGASPGGAQAAPQNGNPAASEAAGSGSSGFSEVFGQATGASSGQMGVFLPLVLIAALVLALVYGWRRRQHPEQKAAS